MLLILSFLFLFGPSGQAEIIAPDPRNFSQISDFHPDWCTAKVEGFDVVAVCYGKSLFRKSIQIRSILLKNSAGVSRLYVEDQWPSVDLLKPAFGLIGPVHGLPGRAPEAGDAVVQFDRHGEVIEVLMQTPSLGKLRAIR